MAYSPAKHRRREDKLSMTDLFDLLQAKELQIIELKNDKLKTELSLEHQSQLSRDKLTQASNLEDLNSQLSSDLRDRDRHIHDLSLTIRQSQDLNESKERRLKERFREKTLEMKGLVAKLKSLQDDTKFRLESQVSRISALMSQSEDKLFELVDYIEELKLTHSELQASQSIFRDDEVELSRLMQENDQLKHLTAHVSDK